MQMPGRRFSQASKNYRYGFNGKEEDDEVKGDGNQQDYGMRIYDTRIGKFLSVDPLTPKYPELTPYQFSSNSPIYMIDIDGLEGAEAIKGAANAGKSAANNQKNQGSTSNYVSQSVNAAAGVIGKAGSFKEENKFDFSGAKMDKVAYVKTGNRGLDIVTNLANGSISHNIASNVTNGTIGLAEDITNVALSSDGRKDVADKFVNNAVGTAKSIYHLNLRLQNEGLSKVGGEMINQLATPEGIEGAGTAVGGFLLTRGLAEVPIGFRIPFARGATIEGGINTTATTSTSFAEGSFSVFDWKGYPAGGVKPTGPFRLLEGAEYSTARKLADKTNAAIHRANPQLKGLQIHELHPVKFGGSPTDIANKIYLKPTDHRLYNTFWFKLQNSIQK